MPLELNNEPTAIYSEDAFRHFLNIERERSVRSGRRSLLVRVGLTSGDGFSQELRPVADAVFAGLAHSIRETDFMGWYREPRLVGAVLTELSSEGNTDVVERVVARIQRSCEGRIPPHSAHRLDISVTPITEEDVRS